MKKESAENNLFVWLEEHAVLGWVSISLASLVEVGFNPALAVCSFAGVLSSLAGATLRTQGAIGSRPVERGDAARSALTWGLGGAAAMEIILLLARTLN